MSIMQATPRSSAPPRWAVDPQKSSVEFAVKTFWGLATVRGRFERFDGGYDAGPAGQSIKLTIDAGSLDTGNGKRDEHLRSADFFHIADHPQVRFTSTRVRSTGDGTLHVAGDLEAAGVVVPLEFDAVTREVGEELEVEAAPTVDPRRFGMSAGHLGMIRPPARLHITARLSEMRADTEQASALAPVGVGP
jgi:polyisoprenoid-binding protein YceI